MTLFSRISASKRVTILIVSTLPTVIPVLAYARQVSARTSADMSVAQENAVVERYCAVCHNDTSRNGGLSLQHFDSSQVEPSLAAMMLSKAKSGAIGASGQAPDKATQAAFTAALSSQSAGAEKWTVSRGQDPTTKAPLLTANIVRSISLPQTVEFFRLKLTCQPETHEAEIQLAWAPDPGQSGRTIAVEADGGPSIEYRIEGSERMGNGMKKPDGTDVTTGPASAVLYSTASNAPQLAATLPMRELRVRNLFPNQTLVFPFETLAQTMRQDLSTCFSSTGAK